MEPNLLPTKPPATRRPLVNRAMRLRRKRTWRSRLVARGRRRSTVAQRLPG